MRRIVQWLVLGMMLTSSSMPAVCADVTHGTAVYTGVCAECHGANPLNNIYNVLNGANNAALIQFFIDNTFPMQPLAYLSTADVADVAAYLGSVVAPPAVIPQPGYWWNPAEGGRGFTIEHNGTNLFMAAYLYVAAGSSTWYGAGPAPTAGPTFSAPMTAYSGGQTLTGTYKPPTQGISPGNISITFTDVTHGTLVWPGGTIPIQRYEFTANGLNSPPTPAQPQTGWWWNPNEGGRGFSIEVQNSKAFIATFMYDSFGNPVWYASGPGALSNNTYQGSWTAYSGGQTLTGTYHAPTGTTSAGNLTVQFTSPTAGTLTLPDGRQIPIQRFSF